jgi:phosphoribosyl 1,2-cyclic phosphodiesterase
MNITFWGVRGSIPTSPSAQEIKKKIKRVLRGAQGVDLDDKAAVNAYMDSLPPIQTGVAGGNSACVEVRFNNALFIFDAGSGLRPLGLDLMQREFAKGQGEAHIFLSHTHWDHIMGFPFFVPAFIPGNHIHFYGCYEDLEDRIAYQQEDRHFPVSMAMMAAEKSYHTLIPDEPHIIAGITIYPFTMFHPGQSFGYRIEHNGRVFVYASDTEFSTTREEDTMYLRDADLLVLDTMYTFEEALAKTDWGHCSPFIGVDIALAENVKKLALFHHEPTYDDRKLERLLDKTIQYKEKMAPGSPLEIILAVEGLTLDLS